jgi:hypothetical protein
MQRPLLKVANATLARGERETLHDRLHATERDDKNDRIEKTPVKSPKQRFYGQSSGENP